MEKTKAAEVEDFDLAAMKKIQADEIRAKIFGYLRNNDLINLIKVSLIKLINRFFMWLGRSNTSLLKGFCYIFKLKTLSPIWIG